MVNYRLPEALVPEFQRPHGRLYPGEDPPVDLDAARPLLVVGDVTLRNLLGQGHTPRVAVVDRQTRRDRAYDEVPPPPSGTLELSAVNPAGQLTQELWSALLTALDHPGPARVLVEGEEDLATLALMVLAPLGSQIAYGQPGEGLVVMDLDDSLRAKAYELLEMMEEY